jgi:hypothetical protein
LRKLLRERCLASRSNRSTSSSKVTVVLMAASWCFEDLLSRCLFASVFTGAHLNPYSSAFWRWRQNKNQQRAEQPLHLGGQVEPHAIDAQLDVSVGKVENNGPLP